jgi:hypothetical protein
MPHPSLIERAWSALRAMGPQLETVLLPGGLLILFVLLIVGRRKTFGTRLGVRLQATARHAFRKAERSQRY